MVFRSLLEQERITDFPPLAKELEAYFLGLRSDPSTLKKLKIGILFSGGPAPGGHNVIWGLFEALDALETLPETKSELIGFLGGPSGLLENRFKILSREEIDGYRNQGGFDLLGSGRTKIEKEEDFQRAGEAIKSLKLDALVFIGGDDTNTNAFYLDRYLKESKISCAVIGCPKTVDGDIKSEDVEISFGFDTACKVYSEMIGNIGRDATSSKKYWHFIKLMGRKASHVTLECALQTQPNLTFIGEEVFYNRLNLNEVVSYIADCVEDRSKQGKNYGVILIPEGLLEFIPEVSELIGELNRLIAKGLTVQSLTPQSKFCFDRFPAEIARSLLEERDPHGNVQLSLIETEKFFSLLVKEELNKRKSAAKFNPVHHFFGYEGRSATPSLFDATYCYNLGCVVARLIFEGKSGVLASLKGLIKAPETWRSLGVDLSTMMVQEERKGEMKGVVKKALVDLKGPVFRRFLELREGWRLQDAYTSPGPIQFSRKEKLVITKTLSLEHN